MQSATSGQFQSPKASDGNEKRWTTPADIGTVERTIAALKERGIQADFALTRAEALGRLTELIPAGSEVMTGSSKTLEEIGFLETLKSGSHSWKNLKAEILAEKDQAKQMELRQRSVLTQYYLGSVHAVTESGQVLIASAGGSQLAAYAAGAKNVIWVVGTQKIVPNLDDGLARIREHSLPLEDQRMKSVGYPGSFVGKILIVEKETPYQNVRLIFVNESLGF
ncbi:MAG: lactate utilization protein [Thaumarchaeota archaeon]|nr:lactate utilization protein [Nitrososphaerota archaeon]